MAGRAKEERPALLLAAGSCGVSGGKSSRIGSRITRTAVPGILSEFSAEATHRAVVAGRVFRGAMTGMKWPFEGLVFRLEGRHHAAVAEHSHNARKHGQRGSWKKSRVARKNEVKNAPQRA